MNPEGLELPVVEAGAAQLLVVQVEAEGFDQVQVNLLAQRRTILPVLGDFRLVENNIEHALVWA